MRLALIHRTAGAEPQAPSGSTAWRTCLREIHFLPGYDGPSEPGVLTDADAYALLLEVVCGLRSPLLGETEVQAQFKQFLASGEATGHRWLRRVGQRVLGDAKRIRHKHLQGFGAHSYGRLAARYFRGTRVAVIGTGALATQVVESAPDSAEVDVWGRSADRLLPDRQARFTFARLTEAAGHRAARAGTTTLVVAAPVEAGALNDVAACYPSLLNVVDLRPADQQTAVDHAAPVLVLADLLAEAARTDAAAVPRLRAARADIRDLALAFAGREELRPFGWDDVCV